MTTDSETTEQYLTFVRSRFLISVLVFVSRDFEFGRVSVQFMLLQLQLYSLGGGGVRRRPSVPYGANFLSFSQCCSQGLKRLEDKDL